MKKKLFSFIILFCMQSMCMEQDISLQESILPKDILYVIANTNLGIKDIYHLNQVNKWFNNKFDYWMINPIALTQEDNLLLASGFMYFNQENNKKNNQKNYTFFSENTPKSLREQLLNLVNVNEKNNLNSSFNFDNLLSNKIVQHVAARLYPNMKNHCNTSMLIWACRKNNLEMIQLLLTKNSDINSKDNDGNTALIWACSNNNIEIVKLLLAKNPDINSKNNDGYTALIWACRKNNIKMVQLLLTKNPDINSKDNDGDTALMWACYNNNIKMIELLFTKNPDINSKNNDGNTVLMWACYNNNIEMVKLLLTKKS